MASNHYKAIVIDIDGTLVSNDGTISPDNSRALSRANELGLKICLSTGRAIQACRRIITELGLDGYHIFFDGALVSSSTSERVVYSRPINRETLRHVIAFSRQNDISIDLYSASRYYVERESWSSNLHRDFFGVEPTITEFANLWKQDTIIKAGMVTTSEEEFVKTEAIRKQFIDRLRFSRVKTPSYPDTEFLNIVSPGVSKGSAMEALSEHMGIEPDEIVAIGDGMNDIELLASAGLGIAMGNAPDEVKAIADEVTLDVNNSGMAKAIEKLLA